MREPHLKEPYGVRAVLNYQIMSWDIVVVEGWDEDLIGRLVTTAPSVSTVAEIERRARDEIVKLSGHTYTTVRLLEIRA